MKTAVIAPSKNYYQKWYVNDKNPGREYKHINSESDTFSEKFGGLIVLGENTLTFKNLKLINLVCERIPEDILNNL